jgi:large repetitive protein
MSKPGMAKSRARRLIGRPGLETLEGRVLPAGTNWISAFGIGVSGLHSTIMSNAVATDSTGDTYITGSFRGTASFNPNSSASTITTAGTQDTFVAKYGPTDSLIWVKTFAGTTTTSGNFTISAVSQGSAITVDPSGNVFVAGGFSGTVDLTGTSGVTAISSPIATTEVYLAKLDPNGNLTWVDTVAGTQFDIDQAFSLALDGSGGVIMAGSFADSATFGSTTLTATGASDAFASHVNSSGLFLWSVESQGQNGSNAQINGVAVDGSGNVVLAGFFSGTIDVDPTASQTTLVSDGSDDALIWKLTSAGSFVWARSYGSTDYDAATAVAVDPQGNIYATGAFSDTVSFGSTALTAGPTFDTFVLKLNSTGGVLWADGLVGPGGWSKGQGIAIDPSGDVELGGTFQGEVNFNPNGGTDDLTSVGETDVFAAGLDTNGNFLFALQAGETNSNATLGVSVNASGLVEATGTYSGSIGFGSNTLPTFTSVSAFIATLQSPSATPASPSAPLLDPSSDTGLSSTDGITSARSPLFDINTAVAGDTVELLRNGLVVGSRVGPGQIRDPGLLSQGTYTYTALQISPSSLSSPQSAGTSITVLITPPSAPPTPTLDPADDSGTLGDGITNVSDPRLLVVALAANTTVQVVNASGTVLASAFASSAGTYTMQLAQPLIAGTYLLEARAIDLAGNISADSLAFSLTIMTATPPTPSVPVLDPPDISGPAGGTLTNVREPRFIGTGKVGTTVEIFLTTGVMIASAPVASNGTYTAQVSSPLSDGSYTVDAVDVDVAANQSLPSATSSLTIDGTPPAAPTALGILPADDSGTVGDGITNVVQPRLTGQAVAGSTVQIVDGTGKVYATAVTLSSGTFTAMVTFPLPNGTYELQARATDLAGNVGLLGNEFSLTILKQTLAAPSAPALLAADDSGTLTTTNVRQPRLTGTAPANTTVQILGTTGTVYASVNSGSSGTYTVKLANSLLDGTYVLHAVATDVAGNVSPASPTFSLIILTSTPATPSAPTLLAADDSGPVGGDITNVRQPRLTGTASAGLTVQLVNASNAVIGTTTATSTGAVTVAPSSPLIDGTYVLHFVAVNAAGTDSLPGGTFTLVILGTPPSRLNPPTLLAADVAVGSNGSITTFSRPKLVGTAVAGDQVAWVSSAGTVLATTTASTLNGSYQLQPATALINGLYPVEVRQTDIAGNVSTLSNPFNLTIRVDSGDDFGNGLTAIGVFGNSDDSFYIQNPITGALFSKAFGIPGDVPVNGDFFGDGHNDIAIYRPSTSTYYVFDPVTTAYEVVQLGQAGDIPVPADYDGDGQTDFAVFQPSNNTFTVKMSATNTIYQKVFATIGDIPVPADYFGNGHADIAVYRPSTSTFYVTDPITGSYEIVPLGLPGSTPIPADYEGLGHADFAVFEPSTSNFVVKLSATNTTYVKAFALPGDIPVPGDYFGDGHTDLAVFRPSTATFYEFDIATDIEKVNQWGAAGQVKPVLAPITTWFNFAVSGTTNAIKAPTNTVTPSLLFADVVEIETVSPSMILDSTVSPTRKTSTVDQAIDDLSLESWRP